MKYSAQQTIARHPQILRQLLHHLFLLFLLLLLLLLPFLVPKLQFLILLRFLLSPLLLLILHLRILTQVPLFHRQLNHKRCQQTISLWNNSQRLKTCTSVNK